MLKFKAVADETRLRLAGILSHYELSVNELVQIMGMGQSRISRHLKILTEAGLLRFRRDGLWVFYTAIDKGANADFLASILPFFPDVARLRADLVLARQMLEERATRARQFFNGIAENWDELNREILGDFDLAAVVVEAVPKGCAVAVDLGCGTGHVLVHLCRHVPSTIGVDGSQAMLDLCKKRLESEGVSTSLRIGDLTHLPLADREASFACINLVLHHLPDPAAAFADIHRVLRPGSTLFIADFIKHEDETMRLRYGDHWLGFDQEELAGFLARENFSIEKTRIRKVGRNLSLLMLIAKLQP